MHLHPTCVGSQIIRHVAPQLGAWRKVCAVQLGGHVPCKRVHTSDAARDPGHEHVTPLESHTNTLTSQERLLRQVVAQPRDTTVAHRRPPIVVVTISSRTSARRTEGRARDAGMT